MVLDFVAILLCLLLSYGMGRLAFLLLSDGTFVLIATRNEILRGHGHMLITGPAGTGKTRLVTNLLQQQANTVVLAPTALAAHLIGGSTIHSFFKFPPDTLLPGTTTPSKSVVDLAVAARTLVIDEISMVRVDLMDAMDRALRRYRNMPQVPFGGVRVIMIGDLFQLPPVAQDEDAETLLHHYKGLFFHHAPAVEEMNLELFELTKVYRQRDKIFSSALTRIRAAQQTQHDMDLINRRVVDGLSVRPKERATYIVFTNSKANAVNEMFLQQIEGEVFESRVILSGNATISRVPCEELVRFKIGAQIIFISNDAGGRWQNGRIGKIVGVRGEIVQVELTNNNVIDVPKYDFIVWDYVLKDNNLERIESGSARQYPFKLGWAITAHKSQGQTFDCVHIDISDTQAFADGQMYVALSRCSSLKNLTLSRRIYAQEIRSNTESLAFLAKLRQATS